MTARRSASVYAHTDVTARRLTAGALRKLCDRDPQAGVMMLRWLARSAAEKARAFSKNLEEFIFTDEPDPVVDELIARSAAARQSIADWPEVRVDALITDLAAQLAGHADELAAATVTETGIGCVADKVEKNLFGSLGVAKSLVGKPGVGVIGERESLAEIADPMGVVLGLIPVTNPVSTLVFKTLICIKARNALIASCHPHAAKVGARTLDLLRQGLVRRGASADLVQSVPRRPTRRTTAALMHHPGVSMILATGGTAMVKAAYSSGTPAIGVGPGNAPAWVCADADLEAAARMVVASKGFDHGLICGSENNLVVDRSARETFIGALRQAGAAVLDAADCERLAQVAFDGEHLSRAVLGQPPRPSPRRQASKCRARFACWWRRCRGEPCRVRSERKSSPRSCRCSPPTARTTASGFACSSSATAAPVIRRSSTPAADGFSCPSRSRCR